MKILGNKKKDHSFFAICTGMLSQQTGISWLAYLCHSSMVVKYIGVLCLYKAYCIW